MPMPVEIAFEQNGTTLTFSRSSELKHVRALHGMVRAQINNMITGVTSGYKKTLNVVGVGYKVELKGKKLLLSLGFSHPVLFIPPDGIDFATTSATQFEVSGFNKQLVGEIAAKIREIRPPEPYKGKGVMYDGEYIRRKAGKSAGK